MTSARALWSVDVGTVEIRPGSLGDGLLVETLFSGISRGTERLVFEGRVPASEYERMRGPAMEGAFPFPVKYGYNVVGRIAEGPKTGHLVFALHPHQTHFRLPEAALVPLPESLPPDRAVLAANTETALTLLWDSGAAAGDRIAVIGAGVVGALVAYLAAQLPGAEVTLVDLNAERSALAETLGCQFSLPENAPQECDVVFHLSASAAGLDTAIDCAGMEATVVEGSWYGDAKISVALGGAFHSRRLRICSSQVGHIPPLRAPRWSYGRRMAKALELLADPVLDTLISGETSFNELPDHYARILSDPATLCHRIRYDAP